MNVGRSVAVSPDKEIMEKGNTSAGDRGIVDSSTGVRQQNLQGGGEDGRGRNDGVNGTNGI